VRLPLFGCGRRERELDDEIRSHFELAIGERVERGESREAAERAVRREFGNEARVREVTRMMWGGIWLDRLLQDLRLGMRSLVRHPRYSVACVAILGVGLAAAVTIFSVVQTVLLQPLPYVDADQLVMVETHLMSLDEIDGSSVPNVEDWGALSGSFAGMTYFRRPRISQVTLSGDVPRRVQAGLVGPRFFELAGVPPVGGRTFSLEELRGGESVAVLREDLWRERFGSEEYSPGRSVDIDGGQFAVVGVMPAEFQIPTRDTRLWRPLSVSAWWNEWSTARQTDGVVALGRLRPGVSLDEARTDMSAVAARLREAYEVNADRDVRLTPLAELVSADREARRGLWLLLAAVLVVLVLACANVAGLSVARGSSRAREMGIRTAIGAGRGRLVRQLLTEASVLALIASAIAVLGARFGIEAMSALGPVDLPRFEQLSLSPAAFAFALVTGAATVALFGALPALRASRVSPASALQGGGPTPGGSTALNDLLVAGQAALATVLLVGGGLLVQSYLRATAVDPGYASDRLAIVSVDLPASRYRTDGELLAYHREARRRLGALPGVATSGSISRFFELAASGTDPLGRSERLYAAEGATTDWPNGQPPALGGGGGGGVTAGYLEALEIPLVAGRYLDERDLEIGLRGASEGVEAIVINEAMAEAFWPGREPIGRRFQFGTRAFDAERFSYQVVGVVADVHNQALDEAAGPSFYISDVSPSMDLVVRTSVDAAPLIASIRETLLDLDPALPLDIMTAEAVLMERLALRRIQSGLIAAFAVMALLLATTGVYALLAYYVATRTREIGIRRALGASRSSTVGFVMARSSRPVFSGLGAGLVAAAAGGRALQSLLFEVQALHLGTYLGSVLALLLAASAAAYLPASSAARIEPLEAFRADP
jgi:putative ABC transport system permease protein